MPVPLSATIDIDAPPTAVWAVVSDLERMNKWSPQCVAMKVLRGPVQRGTHTLNLNRRGPLFWPTTSTVTEFEPERAIAFRVNENKSVWSFHLEPTASGTRVVQRRESPNGSRALTTAAANAFFGGTTNFDHELVAGMNETLAKIKAAAESSR